MANAEHDAGGRAIDRVCVQAHCTQHAGEIMAATKTNYRSAASRRKAESVGAGVEPVGRVRRSQLITTYGIGAIIDLEKGSFMPMGLEDWESVTRLPSLIIGEARLQAQLGVSHFRLPP